MALPQKVSRTGRWDVPGIEDCAWNGLVAVCFRDLDELNPVQRVPALVLHYHGEVMNGGHFQYFCNKEHYDHDEVLTALRAIGADGTASVLADAIAHIRAAEPPRPTSVVDYIAAEQVSGMETLDSRFYEVEPQLNRALEIYLETHEAEFIEWVE